MIKKNDLESPLIFVLFLKGKQNKKENLKCDHLFGKYDFFRKDLESPLIFVLFLKGKQNKKEKP